MVNRVPSAQPDLAGHDQAKVVIISDRIGRTVHLVEAAAAEASGQSSGVALLTGVQAAIPPGRTGGVVRPAEVQAVIPTGRLGRVASPVAASRNVITGVPGLIAPEPKNRRKPHAPVWRREKTSRPLR